MFLSTRAKESKRCHAFRQAIESLEKRVLLAYSLDPTFDGDGLLVGPPGFGARSINVQSDGRILTAVTPLGETGAGDFLTRYNANGSLDTSFGRGDGRVDLPNFTGFGAIVLSGNKILAGVSGDEDTQYVYRYNLDGTLDTTFGGGDGIAEVPGIMSLAGIAVQSDGKIDVAGSETHFDISSHDPTSRTPVFDTQTVTRLNPDGSVDTSFGGGDGYVSALMNSGDHFIGGIGVQPGTGNIIVAGTDSSEEHVIVTAWSPNGTYLFKATAPAMKGFVSDIGFQPNGTIILSSTNGVLVGNGNQGSLVRLSPTGQYDSTFAGGNPSSFGQTFEDLEMLPDGRILAAGSAVDPGSTYPYAVVRRFTANGAVDPTFAPGDYVRADWGQQSAGISLDLAGDGKIVLGGYGSSPPDQHPIGMARFAETSQKPFKGSPFHVGDTIQAEDFDLGGEGVAYHDTDATNNGGAYRPTEAVDIEGTSDTGGGYNVGWIMPGEWLEYTVDMGPGGRNIPADLRLASPKSGGMMRFVIDAGTPNQITGNDFAIPNTGSFQNWQTVHLLFPTVEGGVHTVCLEFLSSPNPGGMANLNWFKIYPAQSEDNGVGLKGEYFNNMDFTAPVLTRTDSNINFNWGTGSPDPRIDPDTFSVRWTGKVQVPTTGRYTFYTTTDDGVRLWVNNQLLIDHLTPQAATEWSGSIDLVAGQQYDFRMDYFERAGGAQAKLSWSGPAIAKQIVPTFAFSHATGTGDTQAPSSVPNFRATDVGSESITVAWDAATDNVGVAGYEVRLDMGGGWTALPADARTYTWRNLSSNYTHTAEIRAFDAAANRGPISTIHPRTTGSNVGTGLEGQYFNNMDFTGLVFSRTNENIDFNWGTGSPGTGVDPDTFSVRWKGQILAPTTGRYTFYTTTDDGARLIINGKTIIDKMVPQSATEWSGTIDLVAGQYYSIQMDYFERAGGAQAKLQWSGPGISKQVVPKSALFLH